MLIFPIIRTNKLQSLSFYVQFLGSQIDYTNVYLHISLYDELSMNSYHYILYAFNMKLVAPRNFLFSYGEIFTCILLVH